VIFNSDPKAIHTQSKQLASSSIRTQTFVQTMSRKSAGSSSKRQKTEESAAAMTDPQSCSGWSFLSEVAQKRIQMMSALTDCTVKTKTDGTAFTHLHKVRIQYSSLSIHAHHRGTTAGAATMTIPICAYQVKLAEASGVFR